MPNKMFVEASLGLVLLLGGQLELLLPLLFGDSFPFFCFFSLRINEEVIFLAHAIVLIGHFGRGATTSVNVAPAFVASSTTGCDTRLGTHTDVSLNEFFRCKIHVPFVEVLIHELRGLVVFFVLDDAGGNVVVLALNLLLDQMIELGAYHVGDV